MFNLAQVEENLNILITQFKSIQNKSKKSVNAYHKNTLSFFVKLPKLIILGRICPYLTKKDIISLSSTCSTLRNVVYGPIGFKILSIQFTKNPIQIKYITSDPIIFKESYRISDQSQYEDEKFLKRQRLKFKQILTKKYENYLKSKEKYDAHCDRLRVAKTHLLRIKQQSKFLVIQKEKLQQSTHQYRERLKSLSEGFAEKIKKLDEDNDQLSKQRTKLQNQKEALAGKIRQYQFQIQKTKQDSEKAKQILKKLKSYLLFKQL